MSTRPVAGAVARIVSGAALAVALTGCLTGCLATDQGSGATEGTGPGTTTAAPVPQDRAPAVVGQAHESEVPEGWDEPDDAPVVPVEDLDASARLELLRVQASSHPVDRACVGDRLSASLRFTDAALGHRYGLVTVVNEGPEACSLRGYPGIGARGAWGHRFVVEVEQRAVDTSGQSLPGGDGYVPETVMLGAGESTQVLLEWTGALGEAESEPLGDLLIQPFHGTDPVAVQGASEEAADLSMDSTVRIGPFVG